MSFDPEKCFPMVNLLQSLSGLCFCLRSGGPPFWGTWSLNCYGGPLATNKKVWVTTGIFFNGVASWQIITMNIYMGLTLKVTQKLQQMQNTGAKLVLRTSTFVLISPALAHSLWLLVWFWAVQGMNVDIQHLEWFRTSLSGTAPLRQFYHPSQSLMLQVDLSREAWKSTTRPFSGVVASLWNSCPVEVPQAPNLLAFRKQIKT